VSAWWVCTVLCCMFESFHNLQQMHTAVLQLQCDKKTLAPTCFQALLAHYEAVNVGISDLLLLF
jgi:hypothetical protein